MMNARTKLGFAPVWEILSYSVFLCVFSLLAFYRLDLCPMNDTHEASACVLALELMGRIRAEGLCVFLRAFPAMSMVFYYVGTLQSYMLIPFILVFGRTLFAARALYALCGLLSVLCMGFVCGRWFGRRAGRLAAVLLATSSVFIRSLRLGAAQEETLLVFFFWVGLFFVEIGIAKKSRAAFCAAAFVFGLGLWAKLVFAGYLLGAGLFFALVTVAGHRPFGATLPSASRRRLTSLAAGFFFLLGVLPLVLYNLVSVPRFITLRVIVDAFFRTGRAGAWDVSFAKAGYSFFAVFIERFAHLQSLLSGAVCQRITDAPENVFFPFLFAVSFFFVFYKLWNDRNRGRPGDRKLLFMLCAYGGMFLANALTPGLAFDYHLVVMLPFVCLVCALFLRLVGLMAGSRPLAVLLFSIIVLPHVALESAALGAYFTELAACRSRGEFAGYSEAVRAELMRIGAKRVAVISPGIGGILRYLDGEDMDIVMDYELWAPTRSPEEFCRQSLSPLGDFFLLRARVFPHWAVDADCMDEVAAFVRGQNRSLSLVSTFTDERWDVVYELYAVSVPVPGLSSGEGG